MSARTALPCAARSATVKCGHTDGNALHGFAPEDPTSSLDTITMHAPIASGAGGPARQAPPSGRPQARARGRSPDGSQLLAVRQLRQKVPVTVAPFGAIRSKVSSTVGFELGMTTSTMPSAVTAPPAIHPMLEIVRIPL